jgi:uncharacterized OB-fold protein
MTVYSETVIHVAPAAFQADVPYQVAIITRDEGARVTGRIEGDRVSIGDTVVEVRETDSVLWFRKA